MHGMLLYYDLSLFSKVASEEIAPERLSRRGPESYLKLRLPLMTNVKRTISMTNAIQD